MELSDFLKSKLSQIQDKNPSYSLRSLARKTKLPAGRLSELLSGKRKLSRYYADKLKIGLALTMDESLLLESWIRVPSRKKTIDHELTENEVSALSSWESLAILNLLKTKAFVSNVDWMAQRLAISPTVVEQSLRAMVKIGLISIGEKGYVRIFNTLTTSWDRPSESIRQLHASMIQKSLQAQKEVPVDFREFSSITMAVDSKTLKKAKKMIDHFQDKLAEMMESKESADAVYTFNVQLFPLTKVKVSP